MGTRKRLGGHKKKDVLDLDNVEDVPLQNMVKAWQTLPDPSFINDLSKARSHTVEDYIKEFEKISKTHPRLQNRDKVATVVDAVRTVNDQKTTLICVDIEAFERNTRIVTEVGISIYDPIKESTSIIPSMINTHIILKEAFELRNGAFVLDNKDNFLGGNSLVLSSKSTVHLIQEFFNYYFTERRKLGYDSRFVGHNVSGDLKWLNKMGVKLPESYQILDTEKIYTCTHGQNGCSLGGILKRFNIPHSYLHNAGNDAYFTLVALIQMCDPNLRRLRKLDDFDEDAKFDESVQKEKEALLSQNGVPKRINRPRKKMKSNEFSPYVECLTPEAALLKIFEFH